MQLYSPWALLLLLTLPVMAYLMLRKKRTAGIKFSSVSEVKNCPVSWRIRLRPLLTGARMLCLVVLIIALARPRKGTVLSEISTEGVAMEVVVDHSGSMGTEMDYYGEKLNRLEVVKKVLADFIGGNQKGLMGRNNDLVGLVDFARYSDTLCPLVLGHNVLLEFLKTIQIVNIQSEDGTAIGDAIALASARLKNSEEELKQRKNKLSQLGQNVFGRPMDEDYKIKSKVIILLTDGRNNTGKYAPLEASELAKKWDIKIYTIGIGSSQSFVTVQTPLGDYKMPTGENLDEGLLKGIAEKTGGFYGRADDAKALAEIVKKIDSLEKTQVQSIQYTQYAEHFGIWTLAALGFLMFEMVAGCTVFRKIP